ncbi:hypothetical protein GALL_272620 [mine drainage metagenome]|uniref:Uncharacterized protein n=1 Tax=mine drainage metagenome TaxID=410659 RepID=A0A1J5RS22_9ZZZZ
MPLTRPRTTPRRKTPSAFVCGCRRPSLVANPARRLGYPRPHRGCGVAIDSGGFSLILLPVLCTPKASALTVLPAEEVSWRRTASGASGRGLHHGVAQPADLFAVLVPGCDRCRRRRGTDPSRPRPAGGGCDLYRTEEQRRWGWQPNRADSTVLSRRWRPCSADYTFARQDAHL